MPLFQVLIKDNEYALAKHEYTVAGEQLDRMDEAATEQAQLDEAIAIRLSLGLNCTLCALKLNDWTEAIKLATTVLASDPVSIKALYRRAQVIVTVEPFVLMVHYLKLYISTCDERYLHQQLSSHYALRNHCAVAMRPLCVDIRPLIGYTATHCMLWTNSNQSFIPSAVFRVALTVFGVIHHSRVKYSLGLTVC